MPTFQQEAALKDFINRAMAQPGGPTPEQAAQAAQMAQAGGFSPQDLSALSGGAYSEADVRASAGDLQGVTNYDPSQFAAGQTTEPVNPNFNQPTDTLAANSGQSSMGGSNVHTIRNETVIPQYLQPFVNESTNFSTGSLRALGDILSRPDAMVSPFTSLQYEAQNKAADVARGGGGFIGQAEDVFKEIADGSDIQALAERGGQLLENPNGANALSGFANNSALDPTAMSALQKTASGGDLYGTPGFNNALQASMDAAQPIIASTFSSGGSGGLKSGLAKTAMQKAASDSFAQLYGQNQSNQLNAANTLNSSSLNNRSLQQGAAGQLVGADQNAGSVFSQLANADRGRQLQAAGALPQIGLAGSDILGQVGQQQQTQDERQKLGAINQYQQLLNASFGKVDPNGLFGQTQGTEDQGGGGLSGILGGATSGAKLGGLFGPWGTAIGAIGGGILGAQ